MEGLKHHRILAILVVLHLALAIAYALATPYRTAGRLMHQGRTLARDIGAPDERQHVNYVRHLQDGEGFPVLSTDPAAPDAYENYQSHQPPAYYVLGLGVAKLGSLDLESRPGGLALRILNGVIGAVGVAGVYFFAFWGIRRQVVANLGAAFAALLPMNVALSGAVSNDPLLFSLCSWTLALAAKGIREGFSTRLALGVGALMGIAFLTKTTAIALWPAVAAGLYLGFRTLPSVSTKEKMREGQSKIPPEGNRRSGGREIPEFRKVSVAIALILPLLLAAPWWLRNQQLYGDPLGMKAFTAAFVGSPQAADFIKELGSLAYWTGINDFGLGVGWWTLRSFFGVFGYMDIFWPSTLYTVLSVVLLALVAARIGARNESWIGESVAVRAMGAVLFTVVLALFLRFNAQYFQGQARYILPAMAPIATTIAIGAWRISHVRPLVGFVALAGILVALNVYTLSSLPAEFERRTIASAPTP